MVIGMIPPEVLQETIAASSLQFNQQVAWYQQELNGDGQPATNAYGEKAWKPVQYVSGRAVTVFREAVTAQGFQRLQATTWHLPPHTGVRAGDKLAGFGDDPAHYPPIESVKQVPDPVNAVLEKATTGFT